jgi:hypothetical protein
LYPQLLEIADNLSNVYIHRAISHTSAATDTADEPEMLGQIEQLMVETLPQPSSLSPARVIATGEASKTRGLTALPTAHPLNTVPARIIPDIKAIAGGADMSTYVAVEAAVSQAAPVRSLENTLHHIYNTFSGHSLNRRWRRRHDFRLRY